MTTVRVLLVSDSPSRDMVVTSLETGGIDVARYGEVWAKGGQSHEEKRRTVATELAAVDATVLDLTEERTHPPAALVLGMSVVLGKRSVMIADSSAEGVGSVRHVLRYTPNDSEAMSLFNSALFEALRRPEEDAASEPAQPEVFIGYSHADVEYLDRLRVHLRPLERAATIRSWSDRQIRPGSMWRDEIAEALERASIAILLISADFLSSDFIVTNELPPLLKRARSQGTTILPLILTNCRFERDEQLSEFQAVNDPRQPLSSLGAAEREVFFDRVAAQIEELARDTSAWS
jgi:hypothetical protein